MLNAMPIAKWVLPVPGLPTKIAERPVFITWSKFSAYSFAKANAFC